MTSKNNMDTPNNDGVKSSEAELEGAFCYKCDRRCNKRWGIDESFVVCTSCGSLLKAAINKQPSCS